MANRKHILYRRDCFSGYRNEGDSGAPIAKMLQRRKRAQTPPDTYGFQRSTGLRAAVVSSMRETRVLCGALNTTSGVSSTSFAIDFMASMKRSSSSLDSLSVGSIISAPGTISGNDVVYGWNP